MTKKPILDPDKMYISRAPFMEPMLEKMREHQRYYQEKNTSPAERLDKERKDR